MPVNQSGPPQSAWKVRDDLDTRAQRGRPEDLRDILAQVPVPPPVPGDEL